MSDVNPKLACKLLSPRWRKRRSAATIALVLLQLFISSGDVFAQPRPVYRVSPSVNSVQPSVLPQNLAELIFGRKGSEHSVVRFDVPPQDQPALEAAGRLAAWIGSVQEIRKVAITTSGVSDVVVSCGTADINPAVRLLPPGSRLKIVEHQLQFDGKPIPTDAGVIALLNVAGDNATPTLLVTAQTATGLRKAVENLLRSGTISGMGGGFAIIESVPTNSPEGKKRRPTFMPETQSFALSEVGFRNATVNGFDPEPITIALNTAPGIVVMGPDPRATAIFSYAAGLDPATSTLEVAFNDTPLALYPLDKPEVGKHEEEFAIPVHLVGPRNELRFRFHMVPVVVAPGAPPVETPTATVYESSSVTIDREYAVKLPDLGILRYDGYPLTDAALSDVVIVVPQTQKTAVLPALQIAQRLGQWLARPPQGPRLFFENLSETDKRSSHLIILNPFGSNDLATELEKIEASRDDRAVARFRKTDGSGIVQEVLSPWADGKVVLVIAGGPQGFERAVNAVIDPALVKNLQSDQSMVTGSDVVVPHTSRIRKSFGAMAPWRAASIYLSENPSLLAFALVACCMVLSLFTQSFVVKRKRNDVKQSN